MASVDAAPPVVTQAPAPEAENGASSNPNADNANSTGATKKPPLTKAERRELQEKQRAAKAAATVVKGSGPQGQGQGKSGPKQSKKEPPPNIATGGVSGSASGVSQAQPSARRANFKPGKEVDASGPSATTGAIALADLEAQRKHQTRIFSHFILPKKEGKIGAGIKGEVHPVIIRLGRQFADMKIVGANARCIAMLVAFKTVRDIRLLLDVLDALDVIYTDLVVSFQGHSRLCSSSKPNTPPRSYPVSLTTNQLSCLCKTNGYKHGKRYSRAQVSYQRDQHR
jgi:hypothetical protein